MIPPTQPLKETSVNAPIGLKKRVIDKFDRSMDGSDANAVREKCRSEQPSFDSVGPHRHYNLFFEKLNQAMVFFDLSHHPSNLVGVEHKRLALQDLCSFVGSNLQFVFDAEVYSRVIQMVETNLLSSPVFKTARECDAVWWHLGLVYQFFLRFMDSQMFRAHDFAPFMGPCFFSHLAERFESKDSRERRYLKTTLHCIYDRYSEFRPEINKCIAKALIEFIDGGKRVEGTAELLEIYVEIIGEFDTRLSEHAEFVEAIIIPLHATNALNVYHIELCWCVGRIIAANPPFAETIINGLLDYWPSAGSPKEPLFLVELEGILGRVESAHLSRLEKRLLNQVMHCSESLLSKRCLQQLLILSPLLCELFKKAGHRKLVWGPEAARGILSIF